MQMIFLRSDGHLEPDQTPKLVPSATPGTKFLFSTNERFSKSAIPVTHSKQTTVFLFDTSKRHKTSAIAVTRSRPTAAQISIQYKWKLHDTPPLAKKIANSTVWPPRA
jgi:hypothetical protein